MKVFRFEIDATSTHWETCDVFVEAETKEEAKKLFKKDPWKYDWENWDTIDSEMQEWKIDQVVWDQEMTNFCKERGIGSFTKENEDE